METQLSDHKSKNSIDFLVDENLNVEPVIRSLAQILTELWTFQVNRSTMAAILGLRKSQRTNFAHPLEILS